MVKYKSSDLNAYLLSLFVVIASQTADLANGKPLRGVTIRNWPYANKLENGQFEGFCVDVLNEIARVARITYTLRLAADGKYGGWLNNGSLDGMIGKVYRNESDFAIADLTVLSNRDRFVTFTAPFMEFGLSALIHKRNVGNIRTFRDLIQQTDILYGVKKVGANLPIVSDDPLVFRMLETMDTRPSVYADGEKDGIRRAKSERYAFITESPHNEYVANRDCDLTTIDDQRQHFKFEYAIALAKGSPHEPTISKAIRHLKKTGKLAQLKDKYWKSDNCRSGEVSYVDVGDGAVGGGGVANGTGGESGHIGNVAKLHSREERDKDKDKKKKSDKLKKKNVSPMNGLSAALIVLCLVSLVGRY